MPGFYGREVQNEEDVTESEVLKAKCGIMEGEVLLGQKE